MPSLKEFNVKIASLKNTKKVTETMKMVSTSKLKKAQAAQNSSKVYAHFLNDVISRLAGSAGSFSHPLLEHKENVKKVLIVVVESDKGLCAGFNNNLNKKVNRWFEEKKNTLDIHFKTCGKRAASFFQKIQDLHGDYEGVTAKPSFVEAAKIGLELSTLFTSSEFDEVYFAYNKFKNAISQIPTISKLLPFEAETNENETSSIDYIYEPNQESLLQTLLPKAVNFNIYNVLLENSAGEHAARMTAMDNASSNAGDMIDKFTTLRNRARQAAITTELTEIVAGAESLK